MHTCRLCQKTIPYSVTIDGKRRFLHKRKYCLTCSPFGMRNRRDLSVLGIASDNMRICRICMLLKPLSMFYHHTGHKTLRGTCKSCDKLDRKERLKRFKVECITYKGGKCSICGYNKCIAALDFHHMDKDSKIFNISCMKFGYCVTDDVKKELDKCVLVCRNCHSEIHYAN